MRGSASWLLMPPDKSSASECLRQALVPTTVDAPETMHVIVRGGGEVVLDDPNVQPAYRIIPPGARTSGRSIGAAEVHLPSTDWVVP